MAMISLRYDPCWDGQELNAGRLRVRWNQYGIVFAWSDGKTPPLYRNVWNLGGQRHLCGPLRCHIHWTAFGSKLCSAWQVFSGRLVRDWRVRFESTRNVHEFVLATPLFRLRIADPAWNFSTDCLERRFQFTCLPKQWAIRSGYRTDWRINFDRGTVIATREYLENSCR